MKKLDAALLAGILLLLGVQWIFLRPVRSGFWQKRQAEVENRIEKVFSQEKIQTLQREVERRPELRWRFQAASFGSALILAGSLAALLRLIFALLTGRPLYRRIGEPPPPAWGFSQILRLAAVAWLVINAAGLLETAILSLFRPAWLDRPLVAVTNTLLADGVVLAVSALFFRRWTPAVPAPSRRWPAVGFAVVSYLTFLPLLFAILVGVAALFRAIHHAPSPQPVFTLFLSESRSLVLAWLLILVTFIGPIAEEVFFRGLLYSWLRGKVGVARALFFSAMVFALLHADPVVLLPIFALGLLFGWVYEQTGTLAASISIHILHNSVMLYGAFLVKTLVNLAAAR